MHITALPRQRAYIGHIATHPARPEEVIMLSAPQPLPTADDFAQFGILQHAYVKRSRRRGSTTVSVHAADGSFLGRFPNRDTAFAALRLNDMEPMSVH